MATLVKVCGLTNVPDACAAARSGADWIGLNLVEGPRLIDLDLAVEIATQLPDVSCCVALVAVSVAPAFQQTLRRLGRADIRRLQLYGDVKPETFSDLRGAGFETLAVLRAQSRSSLDDFSMFLNACGTVGPDYVVIDAYDEDSLGGSGRRADWEMIESAKRTGRFDTWPAIILAGGLTPDNVAEAIEVVSPFGVDVSSGVEASAGIKDHAKVEAFVANAKGACFP